MKKEFAKVIVDISHEKVDRPFGYRIPERLADSVTPGVRVKIPFGAGNALRTGYVIEVTDHSEFPRERMKEIDSVLPGTKEPFYDDTGSENRFACEGDRRGKRAKKH